MTAVVSILGGGGLIGGITSIVAPIVRRNVIKADVAKAITDAAGVLVNELQEELAITQTKMREATAEAEKSYTEARRATRALNLAMDKADELERKMMKMIGWIHDPYMTIEQLRVRIPNPTGENGTAHS